MKPAADLVARHVASKAQLASQAAKEIVVNDNTDKFGKPLPPPVPIENLRPELNPGMVSFQSDQSDKFGNTLPSPAPLETVRRELNPGMNDFLTRTGQIPSQSPTPLASASIYQSLPRFSEPQSGGIKSLVPRKDFGSLLSGDSGRSMVNINFGQLQSPAQLLARRGRGGDSMLVHMRPDEVAAMQGMAQRAGTSMTINPMTGLPEAFKLKDLFNINTYTRPVRDVAEKVGLGGVSDALSSGFKTLGQNAQYILPFVPGGMFAGLGGLGQFAASPMGRGLLAGGIGSLAGGRFNLKRGLMSGMTAYGLSSAYQGLQAAGQTPTGGVFGGDVEAQPGGFYGGRPVDLGRAVDQAELVANEINAGMIDPNRGFPELPAQAKAPVSATPPTIPKPEGLMGEVEAAGRGLKNIAMGDKATSGAAQKAFMNQFGRGAATATYMGLTGMAAIQEEEKYLEQAKAQQQISEAEYANRKARIEAAKKRAMDAVRENPWRFDIGGEVAEDYKLQTPQLGGVAPDQKNVFGLAAGGMPPRYVDGPGDGMSDSVKARIGGLQEARLADGEFVIPADVVSHLGNGSSKAGAKQLYAMMDRIRKARTGTTKQGKEIKPSKMMPA